jgi:hypothetical protein
LIPTWQRQNDGIWLGEQVKNETRHSFIFIAFWQWRYFSQKVISTYPSSYITKNRFKEGIRLSIEIRLVEVFRGNPVKITGCW